MAGRDFITAGRITGIADGKRGHAGHCDEAPNEAEDGDESIPAVFLESGI